jgi:photosystem II stability/assembly factor-like uncharacterized protein
MTSKKARRRARPRPVQAPGKAPSSLRTPAVWLAAAGALALVAAAVLAGIVATRGGGSSQQASTAGLPDTPDYHSLLVSPADPQKLTLGTHYGIYRSSDGGRTWDAAGLSSSDAMNLVQTKQATLWLAGHQVLKESTDGGRNWNDVRPAGLPGLDVHGFAAQPNQPKVLYASIAGQGLYRSSDGGESFAGVSTTVGPAVMGLAVTPSGTVFAADMQRGLVASTDGGSSWSLRLGAQAMGVAVQPNNPKRILATGDGIYLSTNGGRTFHQVQKISSGAGPVAWSPSNRRIAYIVGFDRQLYRSDDGGATWAVVA